MTQANAATESRKKRKRPCPPGLLRRVEAAEYCGMSPSEWDRLTSIGHTPEPIRIGGSKMVAWSRHELAEWCKRRCPARVDWAPVWKGILARC